MSTPLPQLVEAGPARAALGLAHRVQRPDTPGPLPTVVLLHGLSGDEGVMWIFAPRLPPGWLLVAPRAPHPELRGGYAWLHRAPDEWPPLSRFEPAVDGLRQLITALPATYGADPKRIWLMGFSQGAALAFAMAMRHPERVRGVAGLVGFLPTGSEELAASRPLAGMPAFLAVGRRDPLIPRERSAEAARLLRLAGAELTHREYEAGHKLPLAGLRDLGGWWRERGADHSEG